MMGVYIKCMEMPTSCNVCPFRKLWPMDDEVQCLVNRDLWNDNSERHKLCPLVPVPQHGRTIDADALDIYRREEQAWHDYKRNPDNEYLEGVKDGLHEAAKQLSTAPTIIPAEEAEDG